jgi:hypothetical protein
MKYDKELQNSALVSAYTATITVLRDMHTAFTVVPPSVTHSSLLAKRREMMPRKRWKIFFNSAKECLESKIKMIPLTLSHRRLTP